MIEKSLRYALLAYRISANMLQNKSSSIMEKIEKCENYLDQGNKVDGTWMDDNSYVLSRAVKCALDLAEKSNEKKDPNGDIKKEYQDLNKCRIYFERRMGIDFDSLIL